MQLLPEMGVFVKERDGQLARMAEKRNAHRILVDRSEGKSHLEDLVVDK